MLAIARRYSYCTDDAHDAWQRALEILIRRAPSLDPATAVAWLRTVVRNEALAVRADRNRHIGIDGFEADELPHRSDPAADREHVERIEAAAEALQRLKPQEAEAFLLLASGMSYREIADAKGWTYTKVNRLLTEGRRAFRHRVEGIEAGLECERWRPLLTRIADGEADQDEIAEVEPHLRRCLACRATLRHDRQVTRVVAAGMPALLLAPGEAAAGGIGSFSGLLRAISDVALGWGVRLQGMVEMATAGKTAAVVASAAAIAGGGVAVDRIAEPAVPQPAPARTHAAPVTDTQFAGRHAVLPASAPSQTDESDDRDPSRSDGANAGVPGPDHEAEFDPLASGGEGSVAATAGQSRADGTSRGGTAVGSEVGTPVRGSDAAKSDGSASGASEFGP